MKGRLKQSGLILILLALPFMAGLRCFAASALGSSPTNTGKKILEPVSLQLKWRHQFQFAGYYAALEKGFYRDAGLEVTLLEPREGEESSDAVISGKAQFGVAMSDLVLLKSKGYPVVALASIYQHSPLVILAPKHTGIENVHDLAGKRIMIEPHSAELLAYLKNEGMPAHKMIVYPHSYGTEQLLAGEIDAMSAYSTDEPFMLLEEGIEYMLFTPRAGGIDFYGDTLYTTEQQIEEHPKRVKAFLNASLKGWKYAMENEEEIIRLIFNNYSRRHSLEHLRYEARMSKRLIMADVVEIGYMNPGRWEHIRNTYARMNMVPEDFSVKGLIYDREPEKELFWFYFILGGTIVLMVLGFFISGRFYKLINSLNEEIDRRKEMETKLRDSRRTLSTLLSNLQGMAYRCKSDPEWTMVLVSEGSYELTGYKPEELIHNEKIAFGHLIHQDDQKRVTREVNDALREFRPFRVTYRLVHRLGAQKWVWEQGRGIFDENGRLKFLEGFIPDISDQKKIEHERETLIEKLEKALNELKVLRGILPICSLCKKIRDDKGNWNQIEAFVQDHSEAEFSHGICPECLRLHYPDINPDDS